MEGRHYIGTRVLLETNGAGRNLLAYIIRTQNFNISGVVLDKEEILKFYRENISESYARPLNIARGIKNLEGIGLIACANHPDKGLYNINWTLLCVNP